MKLRPYPAYKESGVEWLGSVPTEWRTHRLRWLFKRKNETNRADAELLSVYRDYGVIPKSSRDDNFNKPSEDLSSYRYVERGDLVLNKMKTWQGSIAISDFDGIVSPAYYVARPLLKMNLKFIHYLLRSPVYISQYNLLSAGIRPNQWDLSFDDFRNLLSLLPPETEQASIVKFIDRETSKIDTLIAKQAKLIELFNERIIAIVMGAILSSETQYVRLAHVCEVISRPVNQASEISFTRLGVLNRGRGLFEREETDSEDMGDSDFFWVKNGDLVLSGQFAWEGSVAMADEEHEDCVVSHRFPIIKGKPGVVLTEYLLALFMTSHGDFLLNENSRGSAGRNRPLNMSLLLKEKIPIASIAIQNEVANLLRLQKKLKDKALVQIDLLKEHRTALISAAVTGKIDVREAA